MITVYIASPYTKGDVAVNVRNSFLMADKLVELGYAPFPPLFSHFWHFLSPKSYEEWVRLDREWVLRCDCLLRLPGESEGADAEVHLARMNRIPVFHRVEDLVHDLPVRTSDETKRSVNPHLSVGKKGVGVQSSRR